MLFHCLAARNTYTVAPMRHLVLAFSLSLSPLLPPSLFSPKLSRARLVRFIHPRVNIEPRVLTIVYIETISGVPGPSASVFSTVWNRDSGEADDLKLLRSGFRAWSLNTEDQKALIKKYVRDVSNRGLTFFSRRIAPSKGKFIFSVSSNWTLNSSVHADVRILSSRGIRGIERNVARWIVSKKSTFRVASWLVFTTCIALLQMRVLQIIVTTWRTI